MMISSIETAGMAGLVVARWVGMGCARSIAFHGVAIAAREYAYTVGVLAMLACGGHGGEVQHALVLFCITGSHHNASGRYWVCSNRMVTQ